MRKPTRRLAVFALLAFLATSFSVVSTGIANATESVPTLQWPAVTVNNFVQNVITGPNGSVTVPCINTGTGSDLITYNASGQVIQTLPRNVMVDGVQNCILDPRVDKNGTIYGIPAGLNASSSYVTGPNLLAYSGNTLKWKYPLQCSSSNSPKYVIGANGNIYATTRLSDGVHLIGLAPEVAAGQTQPAKVLDIKVADDCSTELFPYKDGIMLHGQSSGNPSYYSYSGKYLGQMIGSIQHEKINAEGQLFVDQYTSGSFTSAQIAKYDPRTGAMVWTRTASTSGANVQWMNLYPTADGGVIALIKEQKMASNGVPVTPTEYLHTLVKLDANGQRGTPLYLPYKPSPNSSDFYNGSPEIAGLDSQGRVAMIRDLVHPITSNGSTYNIDETQITVFNPDTGSVLYQQSMSGNTNPAAGPLYGYYTYLYAKGLANDTLFVAARCTNSCSDSSLKLYPLRVAGLGIDYPRGAVLGANAGTQPAPLRYVAMGDSYSSGQGAGVYDSGTVTGTNKCYKSMNAYGRVLHRNPASAFSIDNFVACGGSVTANVKQYGTYSDVPPQDVALSSSTGLVTITIGGNDIQFAGVITTCADPTKDCDGAISLAYNNMGMLDVLLQNVYLDILAKAPNAKVYVIGYPPIVVPGAGCLVGNNGSDYPFFSEDRKQKGITLLNDLNTKIHSNVDTVRSINPDYQRLRFVDSTASGSPFIGHDVCSSEPYVNGLFLPPSDSSESFHPNVKGQDAYARLVLLAAEVNDGYVDPGGCGNPDFC